MANKTKRPSSVEEQNSEGQILRLAAASKIYSQAKSVLAFQILLTVLGPLVWSVAASEIHNLGVWIVFYSFAATIVDAWSLQQAQSRLRVEAAKMQEDFDRRLFGIVWSELQLGSQPEAERIHIDGKKYLKKNNADLLLNWYPPVLERLPRPLFILACQRISCWWDESIRQNYYNVLLIVLILISLVISYFGIRNGLTLDRFVLTLIAPLTPLLGWGLRELRKEREAVNRLDELRSYIDSAWVDAAEGTLSQARIFTVGAEIQVQMFTYRCRNPLIFNWVYKLTRDTHQQGADAKALDLVNQYENLKRAKMRR